jgi:hypothetical protein
MPKTVIIDIINNRFPEVRVTKGSFVVWRNLDPYPHTVETAPDSSFFFNAGPLFTGGTTSPVYFGSAGSFDYLCRFHHEMSGTIVVEETPAPGTTHPGHGGHDHSGHGSNHLKHFHGFVTGGRSGQRLFMSHTPVIADDRHRYQVILQGSFVEDKHVQAYEAQRNGAFGDGKVQIFHDHLSLVDIGAGNITLLPEASVEYNVTDTTSKPMPGLEEKVPVRIDKVLHFHQFEPDTDYPEGLAYFVYGDTDDVFIDHHITRAPNFHSIARLASRPAFWTPDKFNGVYEILVPSKRIFDVSPKVLPRAAFVDNSFHLFWLPPPGVISPKPQDPLILRDGTPPIYDALLQDGGTEQITIGRFLHFDIGLLNNRVIIT